MINIDINQDELKEMAKEALKKRMEELEEDVFFMDSKQLQKFVNMSWNSIVTHFLSDPEFPKIRLGHKWLFPKAEVVTYMQKYYEAVKGSTGDIQKYVRK